jgi:hypothetical protein
MAATVRTMSENNRILREREAGEELGLWRGPDETLRPGRFVGERLDWCCIKSQLKVFNVIGRYKFR